MKIVQMLMAQEKFSIKCPFTMSAEFIVVHNTASDASARAEINYMLSNNKQVSYHYAVDDKEVVQGLLESRNGWHAGDGANGLGNRKGIGIEICYSKKGGERFKKAEELSAKFVAYLLKEKNWGIEKVKKHQDFSGKYCPHRTLNLGWERYLDMIKKELDKLDSVLRVEIDEEVFIFEGIKLRDTNYIKIREIFEDLGYEVRWNGNGEIVTIKKRG